MSTDAVRSGYRQENVATALAPARQMGIFPTLLPPDQPIRMVAAQDVGHLVVDCLKHPAGKNEIVDIQGPTYTMRQVADKLGAALGRDLQLVNIPRPGWLEALTQAGFSPRIAEVFIEMYDAFASGLFVPRGDRMVSAGTEIDDVIKKLIVPVHG